jgi:hypothetical protein
VPPVESELRRPVCKGKECGCPPGEVTSKNGACVAAPTNNVGACGAGEYWNGGACMSSFPVRGEHILERDLLPGPSGRVWDHRRPRGCPGK